MPTALRCALRMSGMTILDNGLEVTATRIGSLIPTA